MPMCVIAAPATIPATKNTTLLMHSLPDQVGVMPNANPNAR